MRRSAIFLRILVIGTRAIPSGPKSNVSFAGAGALEGGDDGVDVEIAGEGRAPDAACTASSLVIFPPGPVPLMSAGLSFLSSTIARTDGRRSCGLEVDGADAEAEACGVRAGAMPAEALFCATGLEAWVL